MPVRERQRELPFTSACGHKHALLKGMILAQNERWQRALVMQVEREIPLRRESRAANG